MPPSKSIIPADYANWLTILKSRIASAQQRAALAVNQELVRLYHQIGSEILERQTLQGWGAKVIDRLASDLREAFPEMKGFSSSNLKYMRFFAQQCPSGLIGQQPADQLPFHLVCGNEAHVGRVSASVTRQTALESTPLEKLTSTYHAWRENSGSRGGAERAEGKKTSSESLRASASPREYSDVAGFCKSATTAEIAAHGHVLTPGRYVGAEEVADDGDPFEEKMPRLVAELHAQLAESARLAQAIKANLRGLGYGG